VKLCSGGNRQSKASPQQNRPIFLRNCSRPCSGGNRPSKSSYAPAETARAKLAPAETVRACYATVFIHAPAETVRAKPAPAETVRALYASTIMQLFSSMLRRKPSEQIEPCSGGNRPSKARQAFRKKGRGWMRTFWAWQMVVFLCFS